jgi:aromatic-L-amino-acid decarboxylase
MLAAGALMLGPAPCYPRPVPYDLRPVPRAEAESLALKPEALSQHRMLMNFDLDSATRRKLGYQLIDRVNEFYASLPDLPVQLPAEQRTYGPLSNPLPETGEDASQVLDEVCREMVSKGFHVPSANYFGLMNPTPAYMAFLGEALVGALNPQLATLARSQLASKIELETVRWIGERVGWPGPFNGTFTSGGNEANFSGLALALTWKFPLVVEDGVASIGGQPVVYASAESHHSLDKSAGLLGIGRKALRRLPVNAQLQLDPDAVERTIAEDIASGKKPFCVVATAGTTNSGIVDDLLALSEICRRHKLWLHVDGAYGAAAIFSDRHRDVVRGIERADSITLDPHKWLAVPYAAGVILTSHPEVLEQAFAVAAAYMPKAAGASVPDNARISTQWTRRMNSLKLWLTLRVHGRQGYEEHIDHQMALARNFADWIRRSESFELAAPQILPIVNFRLKDADVPEDHMTTAHAAVVDEVTRTGERYISETVCNGHSVIRMMVISYLTEQRHVDALQSALEQAARKLNFQAQSRVG